MKVFKNILNKKSFFKFFQICLMGILVYCSSTPEKREIATEYPETGEEKIIKDLSDNIKEGNIKKYEGTKMLRDAHPKHYGCLKAEFIVPELKNELKVGIFKTPKKYSSWIRYSSALSSIESDEKKTLVGMAIKILDVEGQKLLSEEKEKTFDFVLVSGPIHPMKNAGEFLKLVSRGIWYFFNPFDSHLKEFGLILDGRKRHATPLELRYWSATPYLFGDKKAVKYSAKPCANPTRKVPSVLTENYLREAMIDQVSKEEVCFDFLVQFQSDPNSMPIEDSRVEWDETVSPFIKVGTIKIPKQEFNTEKRMDFCENLSFNPWRTLPEHKPLGSINRARKEVYKEISKLRLNQNGKTLNEPTGKEDF